MRREGFFFLGNNVALDFLNTRPLLDGKRVELLTDFEAVVRWFRAAEMLSEPQARRLVRQWNGTGRAQGTTAELRELREDLRNGAKGWIESGELATGVVRRLNSLLERHPMLKRLTSDVAEYRLTDWFEPAAPEALFVPLAYEAALLFATADRNRVRQCSHCVGMFLDTSKKGTRRWCSMELCGNRAKVAAYAARQRMS